MLGVGDANDHKEVAKAILNARAIADATTKALEPAKKALVATWWLVGATWVLIVADVVLRVWVD